MSKNKKDGGCSLSMSRAKGGTFVHAQIMFDIIRMIMDGFIDNEITDKDLQGFIKSDQSKEPLKCNECGMLYKTPNGLAIHVSKLHKNKKRQTNCVQGFEEKYNQKVGSRAYPHCLE